MSRLLLVADAVRTATGVAGEAVLVAGGRVEAIGAAADLRSPGLREERYPGAVIVPGFIDSHLHPVHYAAVLRRPVLDGAGDLAGVAEILRAAAEDLPPGAPLLADRLDDESLVEGRLPTREELDRAVPGRPVLARRYCGHVAAVNTAALEAAGVRRATPDPPGGRIDRDQDGEPTGVLREKAIDLVAVTLQDPHPVTPEALLEAMRGLASLGLTSVVGILSLDEGSACGPDGELEVLLEVAADLPLRVAVLVHTEDATKLEEAAGDLEGGPGRVRFLGLKAFADGSLGGHTAALRHPYQDRPDTSGLLRLERDDLMPVARRALALGGMVAVHAIGDLATERVLDLFEELVEEGASPDRLRLEHASVLTEGDVERIAGLGAIASVQPAFLASEAGWLEKRLGPRRLPQAYPLRTLAAAGVALAGGSDSPVEPPSPLLGMAAARDRAGLVPDEGVDGADALALFTTGAAWAMGAPPPLSTGTPLDAVVLDRDPVTSSPEELREAGVLAVWVDGVPLPPHMGPVWR